MNSLSSVLFSNEEKKDRAKFEIRSETGRAKLSTSLDKMLLEQLATKQPTNLQDKTIKEKIIAQKEARIHKHNI